MSLSSDGSGNVKIVVIGVGNGGCSAVTAMVSSSLKGVTFIAADADLQALNDCEAEHKIQIKGLGVSTPPYIGYNEVMQSADQIKAALDAADMIFVTDGTGGGTRTGASLAIAQIAEKTEALTIGVFAKPFFFEKEAHLNAGTEYIAEICKHVDCLFVIASDSLINFVHSKVALTEMLKRAYEEICSVVKSISDLITKTGLINLEFSDVRAVMQKAGLVTMSTGISSGETRARDAAMQAVTSPPLEGLSIGEGARVVLMHVNSGSDITIEEVNEAVSVVRKASVEDVNLVYGTVTDDSLGDKMRITVTYNPFSVGPYVQNTNAVSSKIISGLSKEKLKDRLRAIHSAEAPICQVGAMCYSPVPPPNRVEYHCPSCKHKTSYHRNSKGFGLVYACLATIRRKMKTMKKHTGESISLRETSFCRYCFPEIEIPCLSLVLRFDDGTCNVVDDISLQDISLLEAFFEGKLAFEGDCGRTHSLKGKSSRLEELLGNMISS